MQSVLIPDQLFSEASVTASRRGQSLQAFLVTALRHEITEEVAPIDLKLTLAQLELIDAADADVASGNICTSQDVRDFIQGKHDAWIQTHPS